MNLEMLLEVCHEVGESPWAFGELPDQPGTCVIGSDGILWGRIVSTPESPAIPRARFIAFANQDLRPAIEKLLAIRELCERHKTPAVNVGCHELAGKMLRIIEGE